MLPEANILAEYRKLCPDYIPRENDYSDQCYNKFRCAFKRGWDIGYSEGWKDRKTEEFKKGYSPTMETEKPKPPLGLRPKKIADQLRINEILEAIGRYNVDEKQIPIAWINELQELTGNKPDEKNFIVYYEPGETPCFVDDGREIFKNNTEIAKLLIETLSEGKKDFSCPAGFRIAQKINGVYKEIFPAKEPISNV